MAAGDPIHPRARPAAYPGAPVTVAEAASARAPLRPTRWGITDAVIAIGGAFAIGLLYGAVTRAAGWSGGLVLLLGAVVPWLALAGWPLLAAARWGNGARIDLGLDVRFGDVWRGLLGGVVALALGLAAVQLSEWLFGDLDSRASERGVDIAQVGERWQLVVFALLVAFVAPVVEEIAFRGMLWAALGRAGVSPLATWLLTTLVFALAHFEWRRLLVVLASGAVFGFLRLRTGRLGAPIVAHSANNAAGAVGIPFTG